MMEDLKEEIDEEEREKEEEEEAIREQVMMEDFKFVSGMNVVSEMERVESSLD